MRFYLGDRIGPFSAGVSWNAGGHNRRRRVARRSTGGVTWPMVALVVFAVGLIIQFWWIVLPVTAVALYVRHRRRNAPAAPAAVAAPVAGGAATLDAQDCDDVLMSALTEATWAISGLPERDVDRLIIQLRAAQTEHTPHGEGTLAPLAFIPAAGPRPCDHVLAAVLTETAQALTGCPAAHVLDVAVHVRAAITTR